MYAAIMIFSSHMITSFYNKQEEKCEIKTIRTEFAHIGGPNGLHIQINSIAYRR